MNTAEQEDAATLAGERIDDVLKVAKGIAGDEVRLGIAVGLEQFEVGDRLEADDLVTAGIVDDEVAGNGKQKGAASSYIMPVFRSIGASENLGDHVFRLLRRRQYAAQTTPQGRLVRQYHCLEPIQLGAHPIHTGPLLFV